MPTTPPAWRLPPGVDAGLWAYTHDADLARRYDDDLAGTPLLDVDVRFAEECFPTPGRLIDLGCGTGRLLLPFARRGFWTLGVDLSEAMLAVLAEKARLAGVTVHRLKANLAELDGLRPECFDYAACLFSTLGMLVGSGNRRRAVEHVYRVLRPGGRFVLHVHNRGYNVWTRSGRAWLLADFLGGTLGLKERGDRVMVGPGGAGALTLHLFTRRGAVRLLRGVGFEVLEARPVHAGPARPGRLGRWPAYGYLIAARRPTR